MNGAKLRRFWDVFLPRKGRKNFAQGFNPGNHQTSRLALKGREIDSLDATLNAFDLKPFQAYSQGSCGSQG